MCSIRANTNAVLRNQPVTVTHMHRQAGFTLLELMVSVTIMLLLLGGGLAAYIRLNNRQLLIDSGRQLQLLMRTAQKQARVGSKPAGCSRLLSYAVQVVAGQLASANLLAECENSNYTVQSSDFNPGVTSQNAFTVHFYVLTGGVGGAGTFVLQRGNQNVTMTVNQGGEISEPVLGSN